MKVVKTSLFFLGILFTYLTCVQVKRFLSLSFDKVMHYKRQKIFINVQCSGPYPSGNPAYDAFIGGVRAVTQKVVDVSIHLI